MPNSSMKTLPIALSLIAVAQFQSGNVFALPEAMCSLPACPVAVHRYVHQRVAGGVREAGECRSGNVSPNVIGAVQQRLASKGLYDGPKNGVKDEALERAIGRYRQDQGLSAGSIDIELLRKLGIGEDIVDAPGC